MYFILLTIPYNLFMAVVLPVCLNKEKKYSVFLSPKQYVSVSLSLFKHKLFTTKNNGAIYNLLEK